MIECMCTTVRLILISPKSLKQQTTRVEKQCNPNRRMRNVQQMLDEAPSVHCDYSLYTLK